MSDRVTDPAPRKAGQPSARQRARAHIAGTRGITLIELIVAIALLALGTLTAFATLDQARLGVGGEKTRLLARLVAENRIEALTLRALGGQPPDSLPEVVTMGGQQFALEVNRQRTAGGLVELQVQARPLAGGGGVLLRAYLPGGGG